MHETYIGKTVGDPVNGLRTRMNNHISESRKGISSCQFPIHIFNYSKQNN